MSHKHLFVYCGSWFGGSDGYAVEFKCGCERVETRYLEDVPRIGTRLEEVDGRVPTGDAAAALVGGQTQRVDVTSAAPAGSEAS